MYLVFEFVDHTVLDDLEKYPNGLSEMTVRKILWQVLRGVEFCHSHNVSIAFVYKFVLRYVIRQQLKQLNIELPGLTTIMLYGKMITK